MASMLVPHQWMKQYQLLQAGCNNKNHDGPKGKGDGMNSQQQDEHPADNIRATFAR